MADEKGKPEAKQSVQLPHEVPFMDLVREVRDLEQKPTVSPPQSSLSQDAGEQVPVSIPEYADMSYSEILSELRKIDKIKASLDYTDAIAMGRETPLLQRREAPKQESRATAAQAPTPQVKPAILQAQPKAVESASRQIAPATQQDAKVPPYLKPDTAVARREEKKGGGPETNSPGELPKQEKAGGRPVIFEPRQEAQKKREPADDTEVSSLQSQIKQAIDSKSLEKKREPADDDEESSLQSQIKQAIDSKSQEKKRSSAVNMLIERPEPEEKKAKEPTLAPQAPKPEIKVQPKQEPKELPRPDSVSQAQEPLPKTQRQAPVPDHQEPKSFSWPAQPKAAIEPQQAVPTDVKKEQKMPRPEPAGKAEKKGGLFSGLSGLLGGRKKEARGAPLAAKPEMPRQQGPAPIKEAPPERPKEPASKTDSAGLDEKSKELEAWAARLENERKLKASAPEPAKEPEPEPESMLNKLEETKKRIASMRSQKGSKLEDEVDKEQLESLGKYKKEQSRGAKEEDPLARLKEYRRKRKEEWEGK